MNNFANGVSKSDEPENPGRRGLLRGIVGGAVIGVLGVVGVNKYIQKENTLNNLYLSFKGEEENFSKAHEAADMLIHEMDKANIEKIKVSGTGSSNEQIDILRDFLTSHINSHVGHKYTVRKELLDSGFYTKDTLAAISSEASSM